MAARRERVAIGKFSDRDIVKILSLLPSRDKSIPDATPRLVLNAWATEQQVMHETKTTSTTPQTLKKRREVSTPETKCIGAPE